MTFSLSDTNKWAYALIYTAAGAEISGSGNTVSQPTTLNQYGSFWVELHSPVSPYPGYSNPNWPSFNPRLGGGAPYGGPGGPFPIGSGPDHSWVPAGVHLVVVAWNPGHPNDSVSGDVTINVAGGQSCPPTAREEACSCNEGQADAADPVNTQWGVFRESYTDVSLGGRSGVPLMVSRTYASVNAQDLGGPGVVGRFGPGWVSNLDTRVLLNTPAPGLTRVVDQTGAVTDFVERPGVPGQFLPMKPWTHSTLSRDGAGDLTYAMPSGHKTLFVTGSYVRFEDPNGYTTTLTGYDTVVSSLQYATLTEDAASGGRALAITLTNGMVTKVMDPAGRSVNYGYNAGNLESVQDLSGATTKFFYTTPSSGLIRAIRAPNEVAGYGYNPAVENTVHDVENTYDAQGRVATQTDRRVDPADLVTKFEYDYGSVLGRTKITEAFGAPEARARIDTYTAGRRTKVQYLMGTNDSLLGMVKRFEYEPITGRTTKVWNDGASGTLNRLEMESTYDAAGRMLTTKDVQANRTVTFANYTPQGQPTRVTDPAGVVTTATYDAAGNMQTVCRPVANTAPTAPATLDCAGVPVAQRAQTTINYGVAGRPGEPASSQDERGFVTAMIFDAYGYPQSVTNPLGKKTTFVYDNVGRIQNTVSPKGNKAGATPANFRTTFVTDGFGRVTSTVDPLAHATVRAFDPNGNSFSVVDADLKKSLTVVDPANRPIKSRRQVGTNPVVETQTTYRIDGMVFQQIDAASKVTSYSYDAMGRPKTTTDPNGRIATVSYDVDGTVKTRQEPGGNCAATPKVACISYGYDTASQLKSVDYSDGTPDVTNILYDTSGRRTSLQVNSTTPSWAWDTMGRLRSSVDENGDTVSYTYDLSSNVKTVSYGPGKVVTRSYDNAGQFTSLADWQGQTYNFVPDDNGNLEKITFPSATTNEDTFTFDNADRLMGVAFKKGATVLGNLTYARSNADRLSSTTKTPAGLAGPASETYPYDDYGRVTGAGASTYTYDGAENLSKQLGGTKQAFDPANQLCYSTPTTPSATAVGPNCQLPANVPADATRYGYDGRGNRTSKTPPGVTATTYGFDLANRMTTATFPGTASGNNGEYTALNPARIVNTADGTGLPQAKLGVNSTTSVTVLGSGGIPAANVSAVVLNVTASNGTASGFFTLYPATSSAPNPLTSNVNYVATNPIANLVVVKPGTDGKVKVYNGNAQADLTIDVQGYYATSAGTSGATFNPISPSRIADTRPAPDNTGVPVLKIDAGGTLDVPVVGRPGLPTAAECTADPNRCVGSIAANLTVVNNPASGWLAVYPAGTTWPGTSNLNFAANQPLAELSMIKVATAGGYTGKITIKNGSSLPVDVIVDVFGWSGTTDNQAANVLIPLAAPQRAYDTRTPGVNGGCTPSCGPLAAGTVRQVNLAGFGGVPASGIAAVSVTLTVASPSGSGLLIAYPADIPTPATSNLNFQTGTSIANSAIVKTDVNGSIKIMVANAATDVIVDINGYYTRPAAQTWTYAYDANGIRKSKASPTPTGGLTGLTRFTWSSNGGLPLLLKETRPKSAGGAETTFYLYGPGGLPVGQIDDNGTTTATRYLHHDQLGSTRLVTDTSGNSVASYAYDPYGNVTATTGTPTITNMRYAGEYFDTETGFIYLRARVYDPTTGQFLSRDPMVASTREAYGYTGGNPLNATDPSGMIGLPGTDFCIDIGGGCDSIVEQHAEGAQQVADFAGGVLESVTFGNSEEITEGLGVGGRFDLSTKEAGIGRVVGIGFNVWGAAAGGSYFALASGVGALETFYHSCSGPSTPNCGGATVFALLSMILPFGLGQAARRLPYGANQITSLVESVSAFGVDVAALYEEMIVGLYC